MARPAGRDAIAGLPLPNQFHDNIEHDRHERVADQEHDREIHGILLPLYSASSGQTVASTLRQSKAGTRASSRDIEDGGNAQTAHQER